MKPLHLVFFFCPLVLILSACSKNELTERISLSAYEKVLWKSIVVPSNGVLRLYSHHDVHPYLLGMNESTNEVFIFDYLKDELIGLNLIDKDPDWNPGRIYSMGFYKEAYYLLGSSGLFLFDYAGNPIKSWKLQMARYSEMGIIPSFIVSHEGKDYLVARITFYLPEKRQGKLFRENLDHYKLLSLISLDMESVELELSYFVGYPKEGLIGRKLPSTLLRFTAFDNKVNVLFSSDPTIWQYPSIENTSYKRIPFQLSDGDNHYFMEDGEEQDYWRLFSENPSFDLLHVDRANGDHYLQYRAPFDEEHWPKIRSLKGEWVMTEMNNVSKIRTVKFDKEFNHLYEIDNKAEPLLGWFQIVHDGKIFVSGNREPQMGTEFHIYTIEVEPQR